MNFDRVFGIETIDVIIIKIHPELESKMEIIAEALHKIYPRVKTIAAVPVTY